jgi:oxalate decarboxylase
MKFVSRRNLLAATAGGSLVAAAAKAQAQSFGNPDLPPQGAINATPAGLSDPGPKNPTLAGEFPSFQSPPPTDVGDMPLFWASFNNAPKRIQNGGWARQVTQSDFAISEAVSGVNMRLSAGGIRELHWHLAAEWGYMTNGRCRMSGRVIFGISRLVTRTRSKVSDPMDVSSSSYSTKGANRNTIHCC